MNLEEFKKRFKESVIRDTWDKGLPMCYIDDKGRVVRNWKDGTIKVIKE